MSKVVNRCNYCNSVFGDRICYFCSNRCCTSCMTDDKSRCKKCYINKRRLNVKEILKKNKLILIFAGFLWLYAVFPGPLIPGLDPTFYTISVVAAILIMIPLGLAMFFWSLNPPTSDTRRRR